MGVLSGALTGRRFRVVGELPEGWRDAFRERLGKMAFPAVPPSQGKEEVEGWVRVQNLLDTEFDDFNTWLFGNYAVFCLRVDKKSLPGKLLAAHVEKKCEAWAASAGVQRVPLAKKKEIKEALEQEWLDRALPRVALTEIAWNVTGGTAIVSGTSDKVVDRVRKRFQRTFGLELIAWSPLDAVEGREVMEDLLASTPDDLGGEA